MILNNTPENIAVLSNVQSTTEFKIKSNYHSFRILSSGLYANKIRAIIRELSCNAVDSQVAARNFDTQFEVHLPTMLEPYFSIRDFGTGLNHDQVVNIYTTYFESTKTGSNDFIGALGLGSKSPFSYTENFTVTAIKDGIKGIYSAFINDQGVPAIARMADVETDEPNGVEVKFAIDNTNDFNKFKQESETVFSYFPIKPNMTGAKCVIKEVSYDEVNIIDGINVIKHDRYGYDRNSSVAVMGNIAYPIDIPNKDSNLGILANLLDKDLEITFPIGQLEFQASREGLSYTKETIAAIKNKLQELQNKLDGILFAEADSITNEWERAYYLVTKGKINIWINSIRNYVSKNKFKLIDSSYSYINPADFTISEQDLADDYNIKLSVFKVDGACNSTAKQKRYYDAKTGGYIQSWSIPIGNKTVFVESTKYRGALEQAKYHTRQNLSSYLYNKVFVISKVNNNLPCDLARFYNAISNPPTSQIISQNDLLEKPKVVKKVTERNISIMKLRNQQHDGGAKWENIDDINSLDKTKTYYYIPLSGYNPIPMEGYPIPNGIDDLFDDIKDSGNDLLKDITAIYGVRKADMNEVKSRKNWINIQEHLINTLPKTTIKNILGSYAYAMAKYKNVFSNRNLIISHITNTNSKYKMFVDEYYQNVSTNFNTTSYSTLMERYAPEIAKQKLLTECELKYRELNKEYPLLWCVDSSSASAHLAHYINLIDNQTSQMEKI